MSKEDFSDTERALRTLSVEEFLVDLLGGLVPGVLFLTASAAVVIPVLHATLREQGQAGHRALGDALASAFAATANTPNTLWFAIFVISMLLAYVVGHLFYRHDPNGPDRRSFRWLAGAQKYHRGDRRHWWKRRWPLVRQPWRDANPQLLREDLACDDWDDCEFPYRHYDKYLRKRGLYHPLPWAQWTGDAISPAHRSKNYINRLKIQLHQQFPDKCSSIVRNEAHVRLASSTWYVSWALLVLALAGLGVLGALLLTRMWSPVPVDWRSAVGEFLPAFTSCASVGVFALYSWLSVSRFLHYQRMREVYFVLETAKALLKTPPMGLTFSLCATGLSECPQCGKASVACRRSEVDDGGTWAWIVWKHHCSNCGHTTESVQQVPFVANSEALKNAYQSCPMCLDPATMLVHAIENKGSTPLGSMPQ